MAAVLSAITTKGQLDRKWKSHRTNKGKTKCLQIDLNTDSSNLKDIAEKLNQIILDHDKAIIGFEITGQESDNENAKKV